MECGCNTFLRVIAIANVDVHHEWYLVLSFSILILYTLFGRSFSVHIPVYWSVADDLHITNYVVLVQLSFKFEWILENVRMCVSLIFTS